MIDWSLGEYERTAAELAPVAEHVVSLAMLEPGQRVLDLATGTGNAALLAARAGAAVTGIDAASRLIAVAEHRAASAGLEASFVVGDVAALPFADGAFDVALSVFGLIFAPDAERAFAELIRVLAPGGRGLISVWVPAGPIDAMVGIFVRAMAELTGPGPARFPWHDQSAVEDLARRNGVEATFRDGELRITGSSPEAYFDANQRSHPMSVASRPLFERSDAYPAVRAQALAALREGNEDPDGFLVTSPYRVIEIQR